MRKATQKIMRIDGMTCGHCQARVENALNEVEGLSARVNLKNKSAVLSFESKAIITDEQIMEIVREAGYEPVSIEEKKGFLR